MLGSMECLLIILESCRAGWALSILAEAGLLTQSVGAAKRIESSCWISKFEIFDQGEG